MVRALIGEDGGPDKARKGKIRGLFHRFRSVSRRAINNRHRFLGYPPSLALPHIRLRPKAGFGETSAGEGTLLYRGASPSHSLCAEKRVGPPDAVNTGGPGAAH